MAVKCPLCGKGDLIQRTPGAEYATVSSVHEWGCELDETYEFMVSESRAPTYECESCSYVWHSIDELGEDMKNPVED